MEDRSKAATVDVSQARNATVHLTLETKSSNRAAKPWQLRVPSCAPKGSEEAPTQLLLPPAVDKPASSPTATLCEASAKASAGFCKCLSHNSCRTASQFAILLLAGLSVVRVTTVFGVPRLPCYTWVTSVDLLTHLHEHVVQLLPFRSLDAHVDGLADCMPIFAQ